MTEFKDYLGIDIGTTSIKIAYYDSKTNQPINVAFINGDLYYPSYYAVHKKTGRTRSGMDAKNQMSSPQFFVIYEVKRFIGKKYDDESIIEEKNRVTYKVSKNPDDGSVMMQIGPQRSITPSDFYQVILKEIKGIIENQGIKAKNAVVTVPVTFGDTERDLIRKIVKSPEFGMNDVQIFNEPTAAAIDCGIEKAEFEGMFAIFDYGGGTLDVSVIEMTREGEKANFEVIRHGGLRGNGGSDLDQLIVNKVLSDIKDGLTHVEDIDETLKFLKGPKGSARLKKECEDCKIALSSREDYTFSLPLETDDDDEEEVTVTILRSDFETVICGEKFDEAVECLQNVIAEAEDERGTKVNKILMVGGSSQIPYLKTLIEERTKITPEISEHPLLSVSRGAAIKGSSMQIETKERSAYSVGIEITEQGLPLIYTIIEKNTPLPVIGEYTFRVPYDAMDVIRTWVYKDAKLPELNKRIGEIEMYMDAYIPKMNDRVVLRVEMTEEGCLTLTFTLPDSTFGNQFVKNIDINTK